MNLLKLLDLTARQWLAIAVVVVIGLILAKLGTEWLDGKAIEVSLENASGKPVFAYIDNTGRHGSNTVVRTVPTVQGAQTPSGLLVQPAQTRSFGPAVGLFDSPTLHIVDVSEALIADSAHINDCTFDTFSLKKFEMPSRHVKLKWTDKGCELSP